MDKFEELIESYVSIFKIEKDKSIKEIHEFIKYHFCDTPESIYDVREFINNRDSAFSQFVILTKPQITLNEFDITSFAGEIPLECYKSAQKILEEYKIETSEIYSELVKKVEEKLERDKNQNK